MITVLADDITGAAELAGIGVRYGYPTCLMTAAEARQMEHLPECELLVCATDTRSMTEEEAVRTSREVTKMLWDAGAHQFFKKTDSALRGHVVGELKAMLEVLPYDLALYLPANPSKERRIEHGVYTIDGKPLQETDFAFDPEFPATTSNIFERFPELRPYQDELATDSPLYTADMVSVFQLQFLLRQVNLNQTMLAGAADLFETLLRQYASERRSMNPVEENPEDEEELEEAVHGEGAELSSENMEKYHAYSSAEFVTKFKLPELPPFEGLNSEKVLVVCGSTQSHSIEEEPFVIRHSIPMEQMPEALFEGEESAKVWLKSLTPKWKKRSAAILTIGYPSKGGKEFAVRLRQSLAEVVGSLLHKSLPEELVIEGGATAFAILNRLGWHDFRLTDEVAPGVVRMQSMEQPKCFVTLKPGSYSWGKLFE